MLRDWHFWLEIGHYAVLPLTLLALKRVVEAIDRRADVVAKKRVSEVREEFIEEVARVDQLIESHEEKDASRFEDLRLQNERLMNKLEHSDEIAAAKHLDNVGRLEDIKTRTGKTETNVETLMRFYEQWVRSQFAK